MKTILIYMLAAATSKVTSAEIANQIEVQMRQNRDSYLAGDHTAATKAKALGFFDAEMKRLESSSGCGSALLGAAGRACVAERQRAGAWPWPVYYRDPIYNTYAP